MMLKLNKLDYFTTYDIALAGHDTFIIIWLHVKAGWNYVTTAIALEPSVKIKLLSWRF